MKKLNFNYYHDPKIPLQFISEPRRIKEILINLIGNALKFTNEGFITVKTELLLIDD